MEHCELGYLNSFIDEKVMVPESRVSLDDCRRIMQQLAFGIGFIHSKNFAHRDFKPKVRAFCLSYLFNKRA